MGFLGLNDISSMHRGCATTYYMIIVLMGAVRGLYLMVNDRCMACGDVFVEKDSIRTIIKSAFSVSDATSIIGKSVGVLHEDCYDRSVSIPSVVMDRIKRLSKIKPKKSA